MSGLFEGWLEGLLGDFLLKAAAAVFCGYLVFLLIYVLRVLWKKRRRK